MNFVIGIYAHRNAKSSVTRREAKKKERNRMEYNRNIRIYITKSEEEKGI